MTIKDKIKDITQRLIRSGGVGLEEAAKSVFHESNVVPSDELVQDVAYMLRACVDTRGAELDKQIDGILQHINVSSVKGPDKTIINCFSEDRILVSSTPSPSRKYYVNLNQDCYSHEALDKAFKEYWKTSKSFIHEYYQEHTFDYFGNSWSDLHLNKNSQLPLRDVTVPKKITDIPAKLPKFVSHNYFSDREQIFLDSEGNIDHTSPVEKLNDVLSPHGSLKTYPPSQLFTVSSTLAKEASLNIPEHYVVEQLHSLAEQAHEETIVKILYHYAETIKIGPNEIRPPCCSLSYPGKLSEKRSTILGVVLDRIKHWSKVPGNVVLIHPSLLYPHGDVMLERFGGATVVNSCLPEDEVLVLPRYLGMSNFIMEVDRTLFNEREMRGVFSHNRIFNLEDQLRIYVDSANLKVWRFIVDEANG